MTLGCYKRKLKRGNRWFYSGMFLGNTYHSKAIYLTKQECKAAERGRLIEMEKEARNPRVRMNLKELFETRLDYLELTRNNLYYEDNHRHAKLMLKKWGNISASQVTKRMVNTLLMDELRRAKKKKLTNSRPNALLTNIRAFFNYGINKLDLDIKNPCKGIEKFPIDVKLKFIPTNEMVEAVLKDCSIKQRDLVQFCDETACRIGEALRFKVQDILDNHIVLYTRKSRGSDLTPRIIPKPALPKLPKCGRVFREWNKRPRFLEGKTKKKWNWHNLRHRRASIWASGGMSLIEIMSRLGHHNISTTQKYLRLLGFEYR